MRKPNKTQTIEIQSMLDKHNKSKIFPVNIESFLESAARYVKAIKTGRMICSIDKVSASGMSRTLKFVEMARRDNTTQHSLLDFYGFFDVLGHEKVKNSCYFRIHGCGMDMVFNTNYCIMHQLCSYGLITRAQCTELAQMTPSVI